MRSEIGRAQLNKDQGGPIRANWQPTRYRDCALHNDLGFHLDLHWGVDVHSLVVGSDADDEGIPSLAVDSSQMGALAPPANDRVNSQEVAVGNVSSRAVPDVGVE